MMTSAMWPRPMLSLARCLAISALALATSVLAGMGLMMLAGGFLLIFAIVLTAPAALIQRYQAPALSTTRWWTLSTLGGAILGMSAGALASLSYGHGGTVHAQYWSFQSAIMGISIGLFVGLAQAICIGGAARGRWTWALLSVATYGLGALIVDQPFHAPAWVLFSTAYALTFAATLAQTRALVASR